MTEEPSARPVAQALLRRAQHVLFATLLLIGAVRAAADGRHQVATLTVAAALGGWYALGVLRAGRTRGWQHAGQPATGRPRAGQTDARAAHAEHGATEPRSGGRAPSRRAELGWLLALVAGWLALAGLSADFVWLAFALFLLCMQLLPTRVALPAVAALTVAAVAALALDRGRIDPAAVLGPIIGAAVAVVISVVYRDLARLVGELTAAQDRLAIAERRAGALAERERLAREIHDTVAQSLSSIVLLLRAARTVGPADPSGAATHVDDAILAASGALEDTRRLVRALTPADLAGRSLPQALRRLAATSSQLGITTELAIDGEPYELPAPVAVALLRTAQESLANVRRHAAAQRAVLTLTFLPDAVSLDIADDGAGFDPRQPYGPTTGTGLGLASMRARIRETGGVLVIESAPGRPTALSATIPLPGGAA